MQLLQTAHAAGHGARVEVEAASPRGQHEGELYVRHFRRATVPHGDELAQPPAELVSVKIAGPRVIGGGTRPLEALDIQARIADSSVLGGHPGYLVHDL